MLPESAFLVPDWPAPPGVRALQTTRIGGVSGKPWGSLNLGDHVGDDPAHVAHNRARLSQHLPAAPVWLKQVHGTTMIEAQPGGAVPEADAAWTAVPGVVCAVLTADCLPILLCDAAGQHVAAIHAGWRGLCAGIVEAAVDRLGGAGMGWLAWLGPAIGPQAFEVGDEVRAAFLAAQTGAAAAFRPAGRPGKWLADLPELARLRLRNAGVTAIYGGQWCTVSAPERFFSYRRDGQTGRMATLIWLAPPSGV